MPARDWLDREAASLIRRVTSGNAGFNEKKFAARIEPRNEEERMLGGGDTTMQGVEREATKTEEERVMVSS
jgi:hypothetical protein